LTGTIQNAYSLLLLISFFYFEKLK